MRRSLHRWAAPAAVLAGLLVRAIMAAGHHPMVQANSIVGVLFLGFVLLFAGYPIALAGTFVFALPAWILLEDYRRARWPVLALVGAGAGAAVMPAYLGWLVPRGSIDIWPGAGAVAGAAVALAFARVAAPSASTPPASGR